jgi:hemolysin-activating ACP:hemolysin acyltransferase
MTALQNTDLLNGAHAAAPAGANGASQPPVPTPAMRASLEKFRQAVQLSVGQIVLATMNLPRYRNQTLADLEHLFVTPLMRDRVAIARRAPQAPDGEEAVVGIALWATVSDAVDARITEQIKAGVFPVRLGADDWNSGETVWLLDVVAADRQQATSVLANFRKLAGGRAVKIAPLVARLIDPAVAAKLRGAKDATAAMAEPVGRA